MSETSVEGYDDDEERPVSQNVREALLNGLCGVAHGLFDSALEVRLGWPFDKTPAGEQEWLPERWDRLYDQAVLRKCGAAALLLAERFATQDVRRVMPRFVAEEMVLYAALEIASGYVVGETEEAKADTAEMEYLFEALFEDHDFRLLYERRMDGIEDDEALAERMGFANLKFPDWFKPFRQEDDLLPYFEIEGECEHCDAGAFVVLPPAVTDG